MHSAVKAEKETIKTRLENINVKINEHEAASLFTGKWCVDIDYSLFVCLFLKAQKLHIFFLI